MPLERLGFHEQEVFASSAWPDGRLVINAQIDGSGVHVNIDTALRLDLSLEGTFVHDRGLKVERLEKRFGVCYLSQIDALGRIRESGATVFHGEVESGGDSTYAGRLGTRFFNNATLALDAAGPDVALTARSVDTHSGPAPRHRLELVEGTLDKLPVTRAIQDQYGCSHRFLVSTGDIYCYLYLSSLKELWPRRQYWRAVLAKRRRKRIAIQLRFPNGETQEIQCYVQSEPPDYTSPIDSVPVTGSLGVGLLRSWIQVFDFPRHELLLYDYSAVED